MTASKPMFVEITPSLVLPILNQRPTDPSSSSFTVEAQSNEIKPTYPNSHSAQGDTLADESFFLYDTTLNFVDDRTKSLSGADMHYDGPTRTLSFADDRSWDDVGLDLAEGEKGEGEIGIVSLETTLTLDGRAFWPGQGDTVLGYLTAEIQERWEPLMSGGLGHGGEAVGGDEGEGGGGLGPALEEAKVDEDSITDMGSVVWTDEGKGHHVGKMRVG